MLKLRFSAVSITQISYRHLQIYFDLIFDNDAENVCQLRGLVSKLLKFEIALSALLCSICKHMPAAGKTYLDFVRSKI